MRISIYGLLALLSASGVASTAAAPELVVEVVEPDAYQAWVDTRKDGDVSVANAAN